MSEQSIEIEIRLLRDVMNSIFEFIEYDHKKVSISNKGYYWDISEEERYDLKKTPEKLLVGDLEDDWQLIRSIDPEDESSEATIVEITQVIALLRAVQEALLVEKRLP